MKRQSIPLRGFLSSFLKYIESARLVLLIPIHSECLPVLALIANKNVPKQPCCDDDASDLMSERTQTKDHCVWQNGKCLCPCWLDNYA